jgi:hypothetical protein
MAEMKDVRSYISVGQTLEMAERQDVNGIGEAE